MLFTALPLEGAHLIEPQLLEDERGFFARTWCVREAATHGLNLSTVQCSVSHNARRGTLRGMHYQMAPHAEAKLVRCASGAIYDVMIDLREGSVTYMQWYAAELTAANHLMLYVPEGFAHGFQVLTDGTEVLYQMSAFYEPAAARGVRWDDPAFGITWPIARPILSPRDAAYPDFAK